MKCGHSSNLDHFSWSLSEIRGSPLFVVASGYKAILPGGMGQVCYSLPPSLPPSLPSLPPSLTSLPQEVIPLSHQLYIPSHSLLTDPTISQAPPTTDTENPVACQVVMVGMCLLGLVNSGLYAGMTACISINLEGVLYTCNEIHLRYSIQIFQKIKLHKK